MRDPSKCRFFHSEAFEKLPFGFERNPKRHTNTQAFRNMSSEGMGIDLKNTDCHVFWNSDAMLKTKSEKHPSTQVTPPLTSPVRWLWLAGSLRATEAVNDPSVVS